MCPTDGGAWIEGFDPAPEVSGLEINVPVEEVTNLEGFDPAPEVSGLETFDPAPDNGQLKIIASNPQFGPGFTDDEIATILDLISDSDKDFSEITFWRADSNSKDLPAFADVGDPNIMLNNRFFELADKKQIYILIEELNHTHQSLPNGLDKDSADWLEDDATPPWDYGA